MTHQLEQQTKRSQHRVRQLEAEIDTLYSQLGMVAMESKTDLLTGLHNRRSYDDQLGIEIGLAERRGQWVTLMLVSIDHFRAHRDAHGQEASDEILKTVGNCLLKEYFRKTDFVAHLDAEHFAVLMTQTNLKSAQKTAERWCKKMGREAFETSAGIIKVSVSAGIGETTGEEAAQAFHDRTQLALTRAQECSGGQVTVSEGPSAAAAA